MGLPALPGLECFLSHVRKLFTIIYSSISQALPLFSFWDPYNGNVGAFNFVSEVSETVLIFLFFFFLSQASFDILQWTIMQCSGRGAVMGDEEEQDEDLFSVLKKCTDFWG